MRSHKTKLFVGISISALFLYLAFRNVDFGEMMLALRRADYWYLVPATFFMFLSLWFRAYRWGIFFRPLKPMKMKNLFSALMVGYMANTVFPFKLGEFLRAYSIGKAENFSKVASFATIVVERILDVITLLIFLAIALLLQPFPGYVKSSGLAIFVVSMAGIIFLAFLVVKTEATLRFYRRITGFLPSGLSQKGEEILQALLEGLLVLKKPQYYLITAVTSVLIWVFYVIIVQMLIFAFGFNVTYNVPLLASVTVLVMSGISVSVPSSPGYVGTYHFLVMQGLAIYGVPNSDALSFAVVLHIYSMLPTTLLGLYYFTRQHLTLRDALEEEEAIEGSF